MNKKWIKNRKGQALLMVVVISTLTVLILVGIANRLIRSRTSERRTYEFDKAFAASENALEEFVKKLSIDKSCLPSSSLSDYREVGSGCVSDPDVKILVKTKELTDIELSINRPITLFISKAGDFSNPAITQSANINISCNIIDNSAKFVVTRVYEDPSSLRMKVDKIIASCPNNSLQSFQLIDENGSPVVSRNYTRIVRVRMINTANPSAPNPIRIAVDVRDPSGASLASTGVYDFVVIGKGNLESDNIIRFELPRNDYDAPDAFDFVYFAD